MSQQTAACKKIAENIQTALVGAIAPAIMMDNIMKAAQSLAAEGYVWDVALARACQMYPATKHCAECIW